VDNRFKESEEMLLAVAGGVGSSVKNLLWRGVSCGGGADETSWTG
jgi:hypothetical protein